MAVTLKDIARRADISVPAVSLILNGRGDRYSDATREAVVQAAAALNYRPDSMASRSRRQDARRDAIGFLVRSEAGSRMGNYHVHEFICGVNDVLLENRQFMVMVKLNQLYDADSALQPRLIAERFVDGLIVEFGLPQPLEEAIRRYQIPTVWLNSRRQEPFDCVYPDEVHAGRLVTEHLIAMGHRRILFLQADFSHADPLAPKEVRLDHFSLSARPNGYKEAMLAAGLKPEVVATPAVCDVLPDGIDPMRAAIARVIESHSTTQPITAIMTGALADAIRLWLRAAEVQLQCPKDLSIATCSDAYVYRTSWPEITGIACERYRMGWEAAEMILAKVEQEGQPQPSRPFRGSIIPGQTCSAPQIRSKKTARASTATPLQTRQAIRGVVP